MFILILSNPGILNCLGESEELTDDVSSANTYVSNHFFLLFTLFLFSSEGDPTVYVQVEVEKSTDDGSSW